MVRFRKASTTEPLLLKVGAKDFVLEYRSCQLDEGRPTDSLYEMTKPFLARWADMLQNPETKKDVNYVILLNRLQKTTKQSTQTEDAIEMVERWCSTAAQTTSVEEELEMLFFTRLRRINFYLAPENPGLAKYIIAKDFRDRLKDSIVKACRKQLDLPIAVLNNNLITEDTIPDFMLMNALGLGDWERYLFGLMLLGKTAKEIAALTHIPERTILREGRYIWNLISSVWQQA